MSNRENPKIRLDGITVEITEFQLRAEDSSINFDYKILDGDTSPINTPEKLDKFEQQLGKSLITIIDQFIKRIPEVIKKIEESTNGE